MGETERDSQCRHPLRATGRGLALCYTMLSLTIRDMTIGGSRWPGVPVRRELLPGYSSAVWGRVTAGVCAPVIFDILIFLLRSRSLFPGDFQVAVRVIAYWRER
jgi:hypothetical protein